MTSIIDSVRGAEKFSSLNSRTRTWVDVSLSCYDARRFIRKDLYFISFYSLKNKLQSETHIVWLDALETLVSRTMDNIDIVRRDVGDSRDIEYQYRLEIISIPAMQWVRACTRLDRALKIIYNAIEHRKIDDGYDRRLTYPASLLLNRYKHEISETMQNLPKRVIQEQNELLTNLI